MHQVIPDSGAQTLSLAPRWMVVVVVAESSDMSQTLFSFALGLHDKHRPYTQLLGDHVRCGNRSHMSSSIVHHVRLVRTHVVLFPFRMNPIVLNMKSRLPTSRKKDANELIRHSLNSCKHSGLVLSARYGCAARHRRQQTGTAFVLF